MIKIGHCAAFKENYINKQYIASHSLSEIDWVSRLHLLCINKSDLQTRYKHSNIAPKHKHYCQISHDNNKPMSKYQLVAQLEPERKSDKLANAFYLTRDVTRKQFW